MKIFFYIYLVSTVVCVISSIIYDIKVFKSKKEITLYDLASDIFCFLLFFIPVINIILAIASIGILIEPTLDKMKEIVIWRRK